jgi:glucosamine--fructose-6-phosphate aminotransferase (isomerizing)
VVLGGFEKAKEELTQIKDLLISAKGTSYIAANYGAYIMKELEIFETIRVVNPSGFSEKDLKDIRHGGFLTLTQSGNHKDLCNALRLAYSHNLTCFNIVNEENSPIT